MAVNGTHGFERNFSGALPPPTVLECEPELDRDKQQQLKGTYYAPFYKM